MMWIQRFWMEDEGAEITEYALLAVILAVAVLVGGPALQTGLETAFSNLGGKVSSNAAAVK